MDRISVFVSSSAFFPVQRLDVLFHCIKGCLLVASRPSNMLVYLRNRSAQTSLCAAGMR